MMGWLKDHRAIRDARRAAELAWIESTLAWLEEKRLEDERRESEGCRFCKEKELLGQ